ncbi:hypothetical protein PINS_up002008 [Pythium insidiosum]|nr:hypothetical protein PINS_up002008 [Pythium insidiosum]
MIPPKQISKYQFDSAKIAAARKKTPPLSKAISPGTTEADFEKALNGSFATELGLINRPF